MIEYNSDKLISLGEKVSIPGHYNPSVLEAIEFSGTHFGHIEISCEEFTSMCPKTGQPDFAKLYMEYKPSQRLVESKSLKLYLGSYRSVGMFHEAIVQQIGEDLFNLLQPVSLKVNGDFFVRGGISINPRYERTLL